MRWPGVVGLPTAGSLRRTEATQQEWTTAVEMATNKYILCVEGARLWEYPALLFSLNELAVGWGRYTI